MKKTLSFLLIILLTITSVGPANTSNVYAKSKKPTLNKKKIQLTVGETKKIKLKKANKKVKWKVADKEIVKIIKKSDKKNQTVKIKGLKAGKTKVTATCNKKKFVVKVTVKDVVFNTPVEESTVEVTTTIETTTVPATTATVDIETTTVAETETTTPEETTTATPGNIIVDLDKYSISAQEGLALNYYFDGETDLVLTEDYAADTLEVYQDEQWIVVPKLDSYHNKLVGMVAITHDSPFEKGVSLTEVYGTLPVGHYRYIATVDTHYTNTSTQEFPREIYVEFDIVPDENGLNIVAEPVDKEMTVGEDLEILITVVANDNNQTIKYYENPHYIDKYDYSFNWWDTYLTEVIEPEYVERTLSNLGSSTVTVPISKYFGELSPGHYRYNCEVNDIVIPVEFDIV